METVRTIESYVLGALAFGGWPLFLFLVFQARRRAVATVGAYSILAFLIGSIIAAFCSTPPNQNPFPLYSWLALPYLLIIVRFVSRRRYPAIPQITMSFNFAFAMSLVTMTALATSLRSQVPVSEPPELTAARVRHEQEIKTATAPVNVRYAQMLEAIKKALTAKGDSNGALAVQQEMDRLGVAPLKPVGGVGEAKVVVWNQHNAGYNNMGAKSINVALITGGKEVWRRDGIQIPWEASKDTNVEVSVPAVPTDKLRVEIAEAVNGTGGLAEIEYWKRGSNIAKKRRVTVSGFWESNKRVAGETLTDGITSSKDHQVGYWLVPSGEAGWAEINLNIRD
jgi:hypothetical protein